MKQQLLSAFFFFGLTYTLYAQDAIYTANGNRLNNAQLTNITEDRVTFTVQQSDKLSTHNFQRQNVLIAFRKGNFLIVNELSSDLDKAKQELQTFLTTTVWKDKDYLIQAVPFKVISAKISYENDAIVNYVTDDKKSASISKGELIAIFYSDGRHSLIREASEATPILAGVNKQDIGVSSGQTTSAKSAAVSPSSGQQPATQKESQALKPSLPVNEQASETGPRSKEAAPAPQVNKLVLSDEQFQYYRQKALDKVEEFASYLKIIASKSFSDYDRNQAIDQAVRLFMPASTMEVTSKSQPGARRYPIRTYLTNLKRLNYKSVDIEWTEIQYLKELSQAVDGNYYGVITGQQTFIGYGTNTQYSDVTQKNVRVKLERYTKTEDGLDNVKWGLLLGSIGVSAQQAP
ncbi:hypothetical protein [Spirosoma arcticum]